MELNLNDNGARPDRLIPFNTRVKAWHDNYGEFTGTTRMYGVYDDGIHYTIEADDADYGLVNDVHEDSVEVIE